MKKTGNGKCVAKPKTIGIDEIKTIASNAGMTASELLEWGLYSVLETYDGKNNPISDAKDGLELCRTLEGVIPKKIIPLNPLAKFAADAGLNFDELNELALLSAINMLNSSEWPDSTPKEELEDDRRKHGPLIPSFRCDRDKVHPFMARLFSGDLRAVHGATFGDLGSDCVEGEHWFLEGCLERAFGKNSWDESICDLMNIECVIRHCPALQNEAAAIRALIEVERVLGDFSRAVNAC